MTSTQPDFTFTYHATQCERFRTDTLAEEWREKYPERFDDENLKLLAMQHQPMYHFCEWFSAILLYEATGYRSLVEGYSARTHPKKRERRESLVGSGTFEWLGKHQSGQQDLLIHRVRTGSVARLELCTLARRRSGSRPEAKNL